MEKTYALVINGVVSNLISWDGVSEFNAEGELVEVTNDLWVEIGYLYTGGLFSKPT